MQALNEEHDGINGALTSTLIRTILESRRALRMALSMMQEIMQSGAAIEWLDETPAPAEGPSAFPSTPNLQVHSGAAAFAFSKRKPSHRPPLRLVSPFRHDSPLVMPGDSSYEDVDEQQDEPATGSTASGFTRREGIGRPSIARS